MKPRVLAPVAPFATLVLALVMPLAVLTSAGVPTAAAGAALAALPSAPAAAPPSVGAAPASALGILPQQVMLDLQGLPYTWQATEVAATLYDASQPPGPTGLPEHIEVTFTPINPSVTLSSTPILYLIPVADYVTLWSAAGNDAVARSIQQIFTLSVALPQPAPTSGMPVLPYEQVGAGLNDVAAQVARASVDTASATKSGYRFAGRFAQDANPVTNQGLRWYYQGFTNDGRFLVAAFHPVVTFALPAGTPNLSPELANAFTVDPFGTILAQTGMLNQLMGTNWSPGLAQLDALIGSLKIDGMRPNGLVDTAWQLAARVPAMQGGVQGAEQPLTNTSQYRLGYRADGTLVIQADCNRLTATYQVSGGVYGRVRAQPGPSTLAACPPGSYDQELLQTVFAAQNYKLRPGGNEMELIKPAAGGSLVFRYLGTADLA